MKKVTKYYRKMQRTFLQVAMGVSLAGFIVVPTISNKTTLALKAALNETYRVVVNGDTIGYVSDATSANTAFLNARTKINEDAAGIAYVDATVSVFKADAGVSVEPEASIEKKIYDKLKASAFVEDKATAYTIRIEDFTVTVASKEDAIKVLESVKSSYDKDNLFTVKLSADGSGDMAVSMNNASVSTNDVDKVSVSLDGEKVSIGEVTSETVIEDGLIALGFAESVKITQTKVPESEIVSVEDAYNEITKETATKETYTVQSGDCLYNIAEKYGMSLDLLYSMNEGMTENTSIFPGDQIVVSVPKPELSVVSVVTESYEEAYEADVVYIETNDYYVGQYVTKSDAVPGYRAVDAVNTYVGGVLVSSQIINEKVLSEPTAKVVYKGTMVAPTYILPLSWFYYISDPYGWRAETGSMHGGIDYAAPHGTPIRASRSGYVSYAGWKGSYGNCVEITHPDGHVTRYAHMSSYAVSYGQSVSQWDTIGYVGSTGFSTGDHLHFEIIIGGSQVNPNNWLN